MHVAVEIDMTLWILLLHFYYVMFQIYWCMYSLRMADGGWNIWENKKKYVQMLLFKERNWIIYVDLF